MSDSPGDVLSAARLALAIRRFKEETPDCRMLAADPIAIVGIGCRLPGDVRSPEECWRVFAGGIDAVTEVPAARWSVDEYCDPDPAALGKTNGRWGGFVSDPDLFDPALFGISPREAASIDPQHRLLLEVAWEAIQDSGRAPESLAGSRAGVFIGICLSDYERLLFEDASAVNSNSCTGTYRSVASGRVSYLLDLRGPSVSVDTACSSSLTAVHAACQSLRSGESDLALTGGVTLHLRPEHYVGLAKLGMLAPDGRCKAFDARADGFVPSEGCGLLVLKRLSDALADGDRTYAVIRGSAANQDGRTNSLTAPSGLAQREVVLEALRNARVPPSRISFVETHGTGTALGDPIEVEALAAALGAASEGAQPCALGAAKTNFGHLEAAAGVTGIIKAALALHHEEIPANLHFEKLNPHISLEGTRFLIPTRPMPWPRGQAPRFAGVSSFGFSGTNAHLVLEEAPRLPARRAAAGEDAAGAWLLPISARSPEALRESARRYRDFLLEGGRDVPLYDICHSAALRRSHYEERLAIAAATREDFGRLLGDFLEGRSRLGMAQGRAPRDPEGVAFVCSGQGSQWAGMGTSLFRQEPVFRAALEECEERIRRCAGWSLIERLLEPAADTKLADTEYAQPAIFAVEVALARLWESWGVKPGAVMGHSGGEVAAAHLAGVLSLDEAVRVVVNRGRLMQAATGLGKMAVAHLPAALVARDLAAAGSKVSIAAINSPESTVISGAADEVDALAAMWRGRGVGCRPMPVNYAFHSGQMQSYSDELVRVLGSVETRQESVPIVSTVAGRAASGMEFDAAYWGRNIRRTVQFAAAVEVAAGMGLKTFLEIGPHPVLLTSVGECLGSHGAPTCLVPSLRRNQDEKTSMLASLGALYVAGYPVAWQAVYSDPAPPVSLPAYPYQRRRFWAARPAAAPANSLHPLLGTRLRSPSIRGAAFEAEIGAASLPYLFDHRIEGAALLPMAAFLEMVQQAAWKASAGRALVDVAVLEPLVLPEDASVTVQVVIEEDRFGVHSLSGEVWKLHASGRIADPEPREGPPDLAGGPPLADAQPHYAGMQAQGAAFGPAFQTIQALRVEPGAAAAHVRLQDSEKTQAALYRIHPALLDGCLQAAAAAAGNREGLYLPFGVDSFESFRDAGTEAWATASLRGSEAADVLSADIDIRDNEGILLARVGGLRLKRRAGAAGSMYRVEWRRAPRGAAMDPAGGRWLVVAANGAAAQLADALRAAGLEAAAAKAGDAIRRAAGVRGVIQLIDPKAGEEISPAQARGCGAVLAVAQDLALGVSGSAPQLWLVTRGAEAVDPADRCDGLFQAPVRGLARTIALEHPELRCVRVDLDVSTPGFQALAQELAGWDGEEEIAFRSGERYVPRLAARRPGGGQPRRWTIPARGRIESLALENMERRAPAAGEVEVEIEASALNFRDVLNVLGMYPGDPGPLGLEFCGRIVRTGGGVTGYGCGDRVMGIAWGSFAAFVTTPAALLVPVPAGLSPVDAATIPNAFLTAYHCLLHLGRLRRGERVLIHAAAGGVGLAAVQVAWRAGAEIFATAGSEEKREYLRSLGVTRVFDSRSLDFAAEVRSVTGGEGVDLVLNSLAGDFIEAGFSALATGGRFIEIGKNAIWSRERVASLGRKISYFVVDLAGPLATDHALIRAHLAKISRLLERGDLRPLPARVFRFDDAAAAFRHLAQARHIGKVVLRHPSRLSVRPDATYLVAGGLGAIGLHVAERLAERGARHLVLAGRRDPSPEAAGRLESLRLAGVRVEVRSVDVCLRERVEALLAEMRQTLPPLAGIVHAAGVLDDGALDRQTWARMEQVMAPKVKGAWNLHELTLGMPLDFFLLFSSVASLTGSPGQAGYAAANAFLDALAHYRQAHGLPAVSVNWGAWTGAGMAARVEAEGRRRVLPCVRPMTARQCLERLEDAMADGAPQIAIVDADWRQWQPATRLLSELVHRPGRPEAIHEESILSRLDAAPERNRRKVMVEYLRERAHSVLGLNGGGPFIDEREPLLRMGMDSLMAV